jgi:hypothetical protein
LDASWVVWVFQRNALKTAFLLSFIRTLRHQAFVKIRDFSGANQVKEVWKAGSCKRRTENIQN